VRSVTTEIGRVQTMVRRMRGGLKAAAAEHASTCCGVVVKVVGLGGSSQGSSAPWAAISGVCPSQIHSLSRNDAQLGTMMPSAASLASLVAACKMVTSLATRSTFGALRSGVPLDIAGYADGCRRIHHLLDILVSIGVAILIHGNVFGDHFVNVGSSGVSCCRPPVAVDALLVDVR